jgi:hypothetical protein
MRSESMEVDGEHQESGVQKKPRVLVSRKTSTTQDRNLGSEERNTTRSVWDMVLIFPYPVCHAFALLRM